ncbi:hypothetical protein DFH09DRAFT_1206539 [Mycena vulgaris]|nr:hypothetical protein DFH09DRAFT_1206539 [Mycena vulgaris]
MPRISAAIANTEPVAQKNANDPMCYPEESPTIDHKCPVCDQVCTKHEFAKKGKATVGSHIHACLAGAQQDTAQQRAEDDYEPRKCDWDSCQKADHLFSDRPTFVAHARTHLTSFYKRPSRNYPIRHCRWLLENGKMCMGVDENDWEKHFGRVHHINIRETVQVHYCVICAQWHVDEPGDGSLWEHHCYHHYDSIYEPFSKRVPGEVDLTPVGVQFTAPLENSVEYAHGTGFDGKHPEFHGHVVQGVALDPMFCPWCIFDDTLPIEARMRQWLETWAFQAHVQTHDELILDNAENLCPVPSCGTHTFSRFDLMAHLVAFHRVPLCGARSLLTVRRLRLPTLIQVPIPSATGDDTDSAPPVKTLAVAAAKPTPHQAGKARLKKERAAAAAASDPAVAGHCYGCSQQYDNIGKHLESSRCRARNEYQLVINGVRLGGHLKWSLEDHDVPGLGRSSVKTHYCGGKCRKQYHDILQHKDDVDCLPTHFRIKLPGQGRKWGLKLNINDWIAEQNSGKSYGAGSKRSRSPPPEDLDDRGEGSSTGKKPRHASGSTGAFLCTACYNPFPDVDSLGSHFGSLGANSECSGRLFRERAQATERLGFRWGPMIRWATWHRNPDRVAADGEDPPMGRPFHY